MSDPLGDGISSVALLDHMGSDLTVVNAARVSFARESRKMAEEDLKLIHYLAAHGHWTPFSQPQLQFRIKMPIFVAREWYRHTVGLTRNEVSRRYVDTTPECYVPIKWRMKSKDGRKQGSSAEIYPWEGAVLRAQQLVTGAVAAYNTFIEAGIAPEMARMLLPQSTYTEFIETGSLAAYARICRLRLAPDAQKETSFYAQAVSELIAPLFPVSWAELVKN